jgi:hypothetical protein
VTSQPVREVGLSRDTPKKTYEYLIAMVRANQVDAEWRTFSPGFKQRLAQRAGRNVDVGDYSHARATIASNETKEMRLLLDSEYVGERAVSENQAVVTIRSGGKEVTPRLVRLTTWELTLRGEGEPVAGFIPRAADVIGIGRDGSVQVRVTPASGTASFLKDVPVDRIEGMTVKAEWYVDDFGNFEEAVGSGFGSSEPPRPPAPPPVAPTPAPRRGPAAPPPPRSPPPPPAPRAPDPDIGSPG